MAGFMSKTLTLTIALDDTKKDSTRASRWNYTIVATARFDLGDGKVPAPYFKPMPFCKDSSKPYYV
ncbi:hypothetical protein PGQ11_007731 [Apiospora arundinis]|uniref:Uncharacterized protein n=1 Tax=Apiospora arundinis TaxID=335852 RepID=A0ABR2IXJ8_9PEZI